MAGTINLAVYMQYYSESCSVNIVSESMVHNDNKTNAIHRSLAIKVMINKSYNDLPESEIHYNILYICASLGISCTQVFVHVCTLNIH